MTPEFQSIIALVVVALAASWLVWRTVVRRGKAGCGGDCGCPTDKLKANVRR